MSIFDACSNNTDQAITKLFLTPYILTLSHLTIQRKIQITKGIYWKNNGFLFSRLILSKNVRKYRIESKCSDITIQLENKSKCDLQMWKRC